MSLLGGSTLEPTPPPFPQRKHRTERPASQGSSDLTTGVPCTPTAEKGDSMFTPWGVAS